MVGTPVVTIPEINNANRAPLQFTSRVKVAIEDERLDPRSLGKTNLTSSTNPAFTTRFALEKTLKNLGFKVVEDGPISVVSTLVRFELLEAKVPDKLQGYVRLRLQVKDPIQTVILSRDYEGSSTTEGSKEERLGSALSDILSQIAVDTELITLLASF